MPDSAPVSFAARSAMMSNTGCTSVGEALITCSTSEVAVCRSSASLVSLNRRAFWMAMTAWSANVRSCAISLSLNGRGGERTRSMVPMPRPCQSIGALISEKLPTWPTRSIT